MLQHETRLSIIWKYFVPAHLALHTRSTYKVASKGPIFWERNKKLGKCEKV